MYDTISNMQKGIIAIIVGVLIIGGIWFVNSQRGAGPEEDIVIGGDAIDGSIQDDEMPEEEEELFGNVEDGSTNSE